MMEHVIVINEYRENIKYPTPDALLTKQQKDTMMSFCTGAEWACNRLIKTIREKRFKHPILIVEEHINLFGSLITWAEERCNEDTEWQIKLYQAAHDACVEILDIFNAME